MMQLQLTSCPANFRTVGLKALSLGDDHHAVIHSRGPVCKHCVHSPFVQVPVLRFQDIVSVEVDGVGDHLTCCSAPADRDIGGASCDCDISGRGWFCGTTEKQRLRGLRRDPGPQSVTKPGLVLLVSLDMLFTSDFTPPTTANTSKLYDSPGPRLRKV